jgi:hypothetical protein
MPYRGPVLPKCPHCNKTSYPDEVAAKMHADRYGLIAKACPKSDVWHLTKVHASS